MQTPRLRLYTKNNSYVRIVQDALGLCPSDAVVQAEHRIAAYAQARHAVLVSMGRMAIYEGLRALQCSGEIILSPMTVPEVISLVILAGFTPVFCDCEPGTWNMDVSLIEGLISEKTVAIMTTHFFGNINTTLAVRALCDKHDLWMIEDAAQAVGAWQNGKHAGTIGDFSIFSFSYPKNVTSFYGGCLVTDNDEIAARVRNAISKYPKVNRRWLYKKVFSCAIADIATFRPFYQLVSVLIRYGYKHNIRPIMAAVTQELNAALLTEVPVDYQVRISPGQALAVADKWKEIDEDVAHRIRCAEIYADHLRGIAGILYPQLPGDRSNTYLYFPLQVADKYALQRYMIERGCDVAIQHAPNCADLPAYKPWYRDCPNARAACRGTVMLPAWRGFPLAQAERYARVIQDFFRS